MTTYGWLFLLFAMVAHFTMLDAFSDSYIAGALTTAGVNIAGALLFSQHESREDAK